MSRYISGTQAPALQSVAARKEYKISAAFRQQTKLAYNKPMKKSSTGLYVVVAGFAFEVAAIAIDQLMQTNRTITSMDVGTPSGACHLIAVVLVLYGGWLAAQRQDN